MMRWACAVALVCASLVSGRAEAQTRADSAAVLLHAADQLRLQGEPLAARALLDYLLRQYSGTAAAADAQRMQLALRRVQQERPGRTELLLGGTTYGAWLGIAVPLMLDEDSPEAFGLGFLAGAPAGFLAARAYTRRHAVTEGQARAITFGGSWGTLQGFGWAEVLDSGVRRHQAPCVPDEPAGCFHYEEVDTPARVAAGVVGGLAGIATGAYLARKPISAGTAAAVSTAALWSGWFGFALGVLADQEDDALLASALIAGNAGLVGGALLAPRWHVTEGRVRLISIGGLIGGLAGVGVLLLTQPDDEQVAIAIPLAGTTLGLLLGIRTTRDRDPPPAAGGQGSLIHIDGGRWALDVPSPSLRLQQGRHGGREAAAYVPLLRARLP